MPAAGKKEVASETAAARSPTAPRFTAAIGQISEPTAAPPDIVVEQAPPVTATSPAKATETFKSSPNLAQSQIALVRTEDRAVGAAPATELLNPRRWGIRSSVEAQLQQCRPFPRIYSSGYSESIDGATDRTKRQPNHLGGSQWHGRYTPGHGADWRIRPSPRLRLPDRCFRHYTTHPTNG